MAHSAEWAHVHGQATVLHHTVIRSVPVGPANHLPQPHVRQQCQPAERDCPWAISSRHGSSRIRPTNHGHSRDSLQSMSTPHHTSPSSLHAMQAHVSRLSRPSTLPASSPALSSSSPVSLAPPLPIVPIPVPPLPVVPSIVPPVVVPPPVPPVVVPPTVIPTVRATVIPTARAPVVPTARAPVIPAVIAAVPEPTPARRRVDGAGMSIRRTRGHQT